MIYTKCGFHGDPIKTKSISVVVFLGEKCIHSLKWIYSSYLPFLDSLTRCTDTHLLKESLGLTVMGRRQTLLKVFVEGLCLVEYGMIGLCLVEYDMIEGLNNLNNEK